MVWRPAVFKNNNRVLARCDESGGLLVENGRVQIRYRAGDNRSYPAAEKNLRVLAEEPPVPDEACAPATPVEPRPRRKAAKGRGAVTDAVPGDAVVAYTDGACSGNPGPAGVGVVLCDRGSRRELSLFLGNETNNIAELSAIRSALREIGDVSRPVRIYTDSKYSIGVLTQNWKAKKNQELVASVRAALGRVADVRLIYVPGHSGQPLNERADELARQAIEERASTGWKTEKGDGLGKPGKGNQG
jgi:ribonuclease HI